ncbi:MAG: methyltransferase domain-containing protein [Candidatus Micrarchaeaceae archaeon]
MDYKLALFLTKYLKNETVADFGCGSGSYLKILKENNINVIGYDINPDTYEITEGLGYTLDLTQNINIPTFDWILSLNVGEHIEIEKEDIFINNIHKHNKKGVIISWATDKHKGLNHVNCHENKYIKDKFIQLGYINDIKDETMLRDKCSLSWFKETLMVFKKQ